MKLTPRRKRDAMEALRAIGAVLLLIGLVVALVAVGMWTTTL